MPLDRFHPAVAAWFGRQFTAPTEPQARAWPSIQARRHTLIAAPTGSGKTLAAFLSAIDALVRKGVVKPLEDRTEVLYVSPLKALSNDIQRNLQTPLEGIQQELRAQGWGEVPIRTLVRTGDTSPADRVAMTRRPPHIVVTTPESLYILLTSEGGRAMLRTVRTVIVDEIHAIIQDKRGSHLALSLERLAALAEPESRELVRVGLSATQNPIEQVARFLFGVADMAPGGEPDCAIIDAGHARDLDLAIELPGSPLQAVMQGEVWEEIYDRLAALIGEHRTTLVFVNTRRMAERVARHLADRIGAEHVTSHHGSLSRQQRLSAEQRLKAGELRALVATASLELGIDIGAVDLVCQLGSTRSIATLMQRVGRSGHTVGGFPKGRLFPLTRDELVEVAALIDSIRRGELDRLEIPEKPLDILAQQIVACVACEEWSEEALFDLVRRAYPYRNLSRDEFHAVVVMLADGFTTRRGRRGAALHRDAVNGRLRGRRGSRLTAITSGGAIPDTADYEVVMEPAGTVVGTVNEDFAVESLAGDIFQLGNASWKILRVEPGRVRVEDAHGQPPRIPFWFGEAPARSREMSEAVCRLRREVSDRLCASRPERAAWEPSAGAFGPNPGAAGSSAAMSWLVEEVGVAQPAAEQIVSYLAASKAALGVLPDERTLVLERFFDETGGMQLVLHSPRGSRVNRAWGLALRKRFCVKFNFELQAAATEDAIVLSLGPMHSFPLEDVFQFLRSGSVRELLVQALLDAPMFGIRWRWNAARALAVPRWRGGRKVPPQLQRMHAEDLLAAVFPDQLACAENIVGQREIPDHPLVEQTIRDCLEEAMDIEGLEALLREMERDEIRMIARDLHEPSPLAQEILSARPYAFLDDAPLEERRTQAVYSRRWLDPGKAAELGTLDASAIQRVREESWPQASDPDELHDALSLIGFLTEAEGASMTRASGRTGLFEELIAQRRACRMRLPPSGGMGAVLWVAAEKIPQLRAAFPSASFEPPLAAPEEFACKSWSEEEGQAELLRSRMEALGPISSTALAASCGLPLSKLDAALAKLEAEGSLLRGRFTPASGGDGEMEWCARRLLARIHRYTINRLRQEIEPVSAADFMRFLVSWHRLAPEDRSESGEGTESLAGLIELLEGFECAASAWEGELLPSRLAQYDPVWLDALCLSGRLVWTRLAPPQGVPASPVRSTPITLLTRGNVSLLEALFRRTDAASSGLSHAALSVHGWLAERGASFFDDLVRGTGLLRSQVENALAELVARGLITCDSFMGLRALLTPSERRPPLGRGRRKGSVAAFGIESAGRWWVLGTDSRRPESAERDDAAGRICGILLRRYGVVFRKLLERETLALPWRELLNVYRRLEARGEIRGGRFVAGFQGEQFALPDAVGLLRALRRESPKGKLVSVSAADPLNLAGIITPGARVAPAPANRILYRDGVPIGVREAGKVRFLVEMDQGSEWQARNVLLRRSVPPQLRAYLGRPA